MSRISAMMVGMLLGGLAVALSFNYHIVQTSEKLIFISKQQASLKDTWVDISKWTMQDWSKHPELSQDLIKAGYGDLITKSVAGGLIEDVLKNMPERK